MLVYLHSVLTLTGINIILALGCFLPMSAGLPSLGQAGFMAVGAYTAATLTLMHGVPFYPALLIGGLVAAIAGLLISFPALRVKGIFLVIMTWGFAETIRVFFLNFEYTGGARGLGGIEPYTDLYAIYGTIALLILFFHRLQSSRMGRAFESIKEDEDAAEAIGINLTREKVLAFSVGAFITGLGGGLYAHYALYIEAENFNFFQSAAILFFCVLGGEQVFWGPILGAIILSILPEMLRSLQDWRLLFYGITLILIMIFRSQGLITKDLLRRREKLTEREVRLRRG